MAKRNAAHYTVLHLRFKLGVPPDVILAHSRTAAASIASAEGLIWKIWLVQHDRSEIGGVYLFSNRENAEAYLNHPVIHALRSNPAVISTQTQLWDVENSLSAITRAPLQDLCAQLSEAAALMAGGR